MTMTKCDRSPVTIGDLAVQALVVLLMRRDPELHALKLSSLPVIGEEDAAEMRADRELCNAVLRQVAAACEGCSYLAKSDLCRDSVCDALDAGSGELASGASSYFCLDPIDGTKGFLRGKQF